MSINAFNIVTEFRFDIAHAVADSKTLQEQAGKISAAANNALDSLKNLGFGLAMQFAAVGSAVGFIGSAIKASEKFEASQRKLANVFLSNQELFGKSGIQFKDAMFMSEKIMENIRKKGLEFAIDPEQLFGQVSAIAPMLLSHGLDDGKLERSTDIARGLMKSAPTLGIDPGLVQSQLISLVMGRAELQNTLFQRLMSETSAFRDNKITSSKAYNTLGNEKRIELLRTALLQFGSNADIIAGNINSLTGQMTLLRSQVMGMYSVFKPIGDAIKKPLLQIIGWVNQFLMVHGEKVAKNLSAILGRLLEDPLAFFVGLKQAAALQGDLKSAGKMAFFIELIHVISVFLAWLKIFSVGLHTRLFAILGSIRGFIVGLMAMIPWAKVFSVAMFALRAAFLVVMKTLLPLLFFMQTLSATGAKLKIIFGKWLADNATRIAEAMNRFQFAFSKLMLPFTMAIGGISDMLSELLGWFVTKEWLLVFFEALAEAFDMLGMAVVGLLSMVAGVTNALAGMVFEMSEGNFKRAFTQIPTYYKEGSDDFWNKHYGKKDGEGEEKEVSKQVTNIGNVNINQQFKEQLEPDRIAFAVTDQLKKLATNPVQAINNLNSKSVGY